LTEESNVEAIASSEKKNAAILEMVQSEQIRANLRSDFSQNARYLTQNYKYEPSMLDGLREHATLLYQVGEYAEAAKLLHFFRYLMHASEMPLSLHWGQFAADMLDGRWDFAFDHFRRLNGFIESKLVQSPVVQLQQRLWLAHWSLFLFFSMEGGRDLLLEHFLQPPYRTLLLSHIVLRFTCAIQVAAPHLLRYVVVAVLLTKRRRTSIRDVLALVSDVDAKADPFVQLFLKLVEQVDLSNLCTSIQECKNAALNDYFLASFADEIEHQSRLFVVETLVQLHGEISLSAASGLLSCSEDLIISALSRSPDLLVENQFIKREVALSAAALIESRLSIEKARTLQLAERFAN